LNSGNLELPSGDIDYLLLLDIIEHLNSPEKFLDNLREILPDKENTTILITVPNVAFFIIRFRLFFGEFQYGKSGILDLTHCRLFTESSLKILLSQSGYEIIDLRGIPAPFPKALGDNFASRALLALNRFFIKLSRGMFSYQIFVRAKALPTVNDLLAVTRESSKKRILQQTQAASESRS